MLYHRLQKKAGTFAVSGFLLLLVFSYITLKQEIPNTIYVQSDEDEVKFSVPVSLTKINKVAEVTNNMESFQGGNVVNALVTDESYTFSCRLFGIIPIKEVTAKVVDEQQLMLGGVPIGIYVETKGVLIIGLGNVESEDGVAEAPAENILRSGDYITEVNQTPIKTKEDLIEAVNASEGEKIELTVNRNNESIQVVILPIKTASNEYKIGVWVRDDLAGIGTITYVTSDMKYGALGHAVSDADTGTMLTMSRGLLYESDIVGIEKGESGTPGELTGVINYDSSYCLGSITSNTTEGIYGTLDSIPKQMNGAQYLPVGYKQDIEKGEATIYCAIDKEVEPYTIEITEVNFQKDEENKEILFKVTDERLLEKTGGIVQGMSGSPIVQNGKIIGAVTHVYIQDATKGYGIFVEDMITH